MNKMINILEEDFKIISDDERIKFEMFRNKHFVISGGTGLVGSLCAKALAYIERKKKLGIKVYVLARNEEKAKNVMKEFANDQSIIIVCNDIIDGAPEIQDTVDYVIHTAAITNSKLMISDPVLTIKTSIWGTEHMLSFAKKHDATMINLSSMEAYGDMGKDSECVTEEQLGTIDLSSVRSCYPESKRMSELLCKSYAYEYQVCVMNLRLAQCFGPGVLPNENRVFAQFARAVIEKKDIVLHTNGESEGNYVYTRDAVTAILFLLQNGVSGETYNVNNEESHTTIREMAYMVSEQVAGGAIKTIFDIPEDSSKYGYAPPVKLHLCANKINRLGWRASVGLKEAYERLIVYMRDKSE